MIMMKYYEPGNIMMSYRDVTIVMKYYDVIVLFPGGGNKRFASCGRKNADENVQLSQHHRS